MNTQFVRSVQIHWDQLPEKSYVRGIPAFEQVDQIEFHHPITFFVGENGSGKSTLLEALAIRCGFNPEGGTRNYSFSTYDDYSDFHEAVTLFKGYRRPKWGYFLRAESFYNVASAEEEYSRYGGRPERLHQQSHGESFLSIVQNNFQADSLYLLDEPEAALSPQRQLTLLAEIFRWAKQGSQFFIVSHSPILLGIPDAEILTFDDGPVHPCRYEDTESYAVTKMFLEHREAFLHRLLSDA